MPLESAVLYLPIGIIGLTRWGIWLVKRVIGMFYAAEPPHDELRGVWLSIVTPVYQESPDGFRAALESWIANMPDEIIAVIDESDQACVEVFEQVARDTEAARERVITAAPSGARSALAHISEPPVLRMIKTAVPGKRPALALGVREATGAIVALVDSDTIWEPDARAKLIAPFVDPAVGGVASRQGVLHSRTLSQRFTAIMFELRATDEMAFLDRAGQGFSCLSGRTALYRRRVLLPILDDLVNETFFGRRCISGDDKRLTYLIQQRGYKTRYQDNTTVYTSAPTKLSTLVKQKVRWSRNSWRADLRALRQGWVWRRPVFVFYLMDKCISAFTMLISPMFLILAIYLQHWVLVAAIPVWWLGSRSLKMWPYLQGRLRDFWIIPLFVLFGFMTGVLKIYALVTLNRQGWLTRGTQARPATVASNVLVPAASYLATVALLSALFLGVIGYYRVVVAVAAVPSTVDALASPADSEGLVAQETSFDNSDRGRLVLPARSSGIPAPHTAPINYSRGDVTGGTADETRNQLHKISRVLGIAASHPNDSPVPIDAGEGNQIGLQLDAQDVYADAQGERSAGGSVKALAKIALVVALVSVVALTAIVGLRRRAGLGSSPKRGPSREWPQ